MSVEAGRCEAFKPDLNEDKIRRYCAQQTARSSSMITGFIASMRRSEADVNAELKANLAIAQADQQLLLLYHAEQHFISRFPRNMAVQVKSIHDVQHPPRGDAKYAVHQMER